MARASLRPTISFILFPGDYGIFYGMASPPTSYGGYGGNANEKPKYTFEYPTGWKSEQPSKVSLLPACNERWYNLSLDLLNVH